MPKLIKESFNAWIDEMPGGPHKLIVQGEAEVPTGGWHANLTPANPQGINPAVLILEASFKDPDGSATQVITLIPCRYDESPPKHGYTNITLRYEGDEFTIDVQEAN